MSLRMSIAPDEVRVRASERIAARDPWTAIGWLRAGLRNAYDDPEFHRLLGHACNQLNDPSSAADSYRRSLAFGGDVDGVRPFLAHSLARSGRPREAVRVYTAHLRCHRHDAHAWSGLGLALSDLGKLDVALAYTTHATRLAPEWRDGHGNRGIVLYRRHALDEALAEFEQAGADSPTDLIARYHASLVHLTRGDYRRGFGDFDAHLRLWVPRFRGGAPPPPLPRAGQTVLVQAHNGLGDTLQFMRYVPRLAGLGAHVVLVVQNALRALLADFPGTRAVLGPNDPVPTHDAAFSLLEMPRIFGDTLEALPTGPYLEADPERTARWAARLGGEGTLRVGLVWHGNPAQREGLYRSCPLRELAALARVPGVTFYSLQVGAGAEEMRARPTGFEVRDLSDELDRDGPFVDTAAILATLDLLISVDTSVCHLAGALGRPVWLLLPNWSDWRWLLATRRSPWYPTFRLFRQPRPFDWCSVVSEVRAELGALAARN